jgi:hypothetical protein
MKTENIKIIAIGSFAFILGMIMLASGVRDMGQNNAISVTGTAEKMVTSDAAKWTLSITRQGDAQALLFVSNSVKSEGLATASYLKSQGIEDKDITVQPIVSNVVCQSQQQVMYDGFGKQQCSGSFNYSITQTIIVESSDVERIKNLSLNAQSELAKKGIVIQTVAVDYFYNKLSELRVELLEEASKNAKERAEAIAKSTGDRIGGVRNASQGVFQVTQRNSIDVSDYGSYDTSTIEKKVTAIVRASFEVK